jgi:hypothetical protein
VRLLERTSKTRFRVFVLLRLARASESELLVDGVVEIEDSEMESGRMTAGLVWSLLLLPTARVDIPAEMKTKYGAVGVRSPRT